MKPEYDLATMQSRPNPYITKLQSKVTITLDQNVIEYFEDISKESGIPYQSLINLYLQDCVTQHRKIDTTWYEQIEHA